MLLRGLSLLQLVALERPHRSQPASSQRWPLCRLGVGLVYCLDLYFFALLKRLFLVSFVRYG
eukprot:10096601-Lingulodinium_polyedra.AAC.1